MAFGILLSVVQIKYLVRRMMVTKFVYRTVLLAISLVAFSFVPLRSGSLRVAAEPFLQGANRVVFLGDSNTYAGQYVAIVEAQIQLSNDGRLPEVINLGLSSETCNGLSEPEHPFPRPNVQERIDRALSKLKPDVVVVCYGMNDGIYSPPSEQTFSAYRNGINQIIRKVHDADAKLVLMTPPAFDPAPMRMKGKLLPLGENEYSWKAIYEDYDDVIEQFANWIKDQSNRTEMVIDLHDPVTEYLAAKRAEDPGFAMSPDGVHVNHEGHQVIADAILSAWGIGNAEKPNPELVSLIAKRQKLMRDAWLSEVGHLRPGIKPGLPIEQATQKARQMDKEITDQVAIQLGRPQNPQ